MLDVETAKLELSRKSMADINTETAWKWASRACASFENSSSETGTNKVLSFSNGQDYLGEAKEHAAQVGSVLVEKIEIATGGYFMDALLSLDKEMKGK